MSLPPCRRGIQCFFANGVIPLFHTSILANTNNAAFFTLLLAQIRELLGRRVIWHESIHRNNYVANSIRRKSRSLHGPETSSKYASVHRATQKSTMKMSHEVPFGSVLANEANCCSRVPFALKAALVEKSRCDSQCQA